LIENYYELKLVFLNLISKFLEKSVPNFNFDGLYLFPEHEQLKIYSEEKQKKKKSYSRQLELIGTTKPFLI